jgi:hypothetical protein
MTGEPWRRGRSWGQLARGRGHCCGDLERLARGLERLICFIYVGFNSGFRRAITVVEGRTSDNFRLAEALKTLAFTGFLEVILILILAGL